MLYEMSAYAFVYVLTKLMFMLYNVYVNFGQVIIGS